MAVFKAERQGPWFYGLSTDTKPTKPGEVPMGSIFVETDTGVHYVFDGAAWRSLKVQANPQA